MATRSRWTLALVAIIGATVSCGRAPSDASLRARFESHRAEFERLAALATADSELVSAHSVWNQVSVYARRDGSMRYLTNEEMHADHREEYGPLLEATAMRHMARAGTRGPLLFMVGPGAALTRKGILYSLTPVTPVRASLDDVDESHLAEGLYSELAPHWYIFLWPHD